MSKKKKKTKHVSDYIYYDFILHLKQIIMSKVTKLVICLQYFSLKLKKVIFLHGSSVIYSISIPIVDRHHVIIFRLKEYDAYSLAFLFNILLVV